MVKITGEPVELYLLFPCSDFNVCFCNPDNFCKIKEVFESMYTWKFPLYMLPYCNVVLIVVIECTYH